jgi:hypothetical protein
MYQLNATAFAVALRSNIAPKQVSLVFVGCLLIIYQVLEEWRSLGAIIFLPFYYTQMMLPDMALYQFQKILSQKILLQ